MVQHVLLKEHAAHTQKKKHLLRINHLIKTKIKRNYFQLFIYSFPFQEIILSRSSLIR